MSTEPVFLKQYGEKRTGTNYLRALLGANYQNATVLMHVLGDKHSPPVDFRALRATTRAQADPAESFVRAATYAAPSETTSSESLPQQQHLAGISGPLAAAYDEDRLFFLISIRHPRSWAAGLARYYNHSFRNDAGSFGPELAAFFRDACQGYNRRYEAWWRHHREFRGRSVVVRHEDLLRDSRRAVEGWAGKFGLVRTAGEWNAVRERVDAAEWDQHESPLAPIPYHIEFYRAESDRNQIGPDLWDVIRETIDWKLAARFGYTPGNWSNWIARKMRSVFS